MVSNGAISYNLAMRRFHLIPNAITAFGLCCGLFVIYKVFLNPGEESLFNFIQAAAILLFIAGVADLADGAAARLFKSESEFGGQFDSLSDAITFGVAPPLLVLRTFPTEQVAPWMRILLTTAAMIYTLCGVVRLVRFNVTAKEGRLKEAFQHKRSYFRGLPIPSAAALIVSTALLMVSPYVEAFLDLSVTTRLFIMVAVMVFAGYFMLSRWLFPGLKTLRMRVPSFYLVLGLGVFAVLLLYGLLDHFALAFFFMTWGYFFSSISFAVLRTKKIEESDAKMKDV